MEARRTLTSVTPEPPARTVTSPRPYAERLRVPWWAWPSCLLMGAILAAEFPMGWLPFAVVLPLIVLALLWIGRLRVAVTATEFQVDDARLPLSAIADVVALDTNGKLEILGVGANPLAFVIQRPWIGGAVQVLLDDPADPTPYWVVSTRHPVELATALLAARG
jgi:Protein of unknown function (DUF3093)